MAKKRSRAAGGDEPTPPKSLVFGLVAQVLAERGCEALERHLSPSGTLRVVVDRDGGAVDADLLVELLRSLRAALRAQGVDPGRLRIEFHSPGERRLLATRGHFERFRGAVVRVRFAHPEREGRDTALYRLVGVEGDRPVLADEAGRRLVLDRERYLSIRVHRAPGADRDDEDGFFD